MNCQLLTRSYCKLLGSLGHSIGSRPLLFLLLPPLLLGALIYPFIAEVRRYSQSEGQDDLEMLWPISSRSARDKAAMGRLFPDGPGDRSLLSPTQFVLLISSKDLGSIWRPEIVVEYNQLLTDLNSINLTENGVNYNYSRLCLVDISTGKCPVDLFLSIWEAQRNGRVRKLSYPILAFYDDNSRGDSPNSLVYIGPLLGGVITDRDGQIRYAKYVRVEWRLSTGGFHDLLLKQFSLKFTKFLAKFQSELINVNYWSAEGFKSDVAKIRSRTLRFSPLLVGVLVLFPISSAFMSSCVTSKPWLALSGVISALMGMTLAFSFLFICKVSMMDLILFIPFLILREYPLSVPPYFI